MTFFITKKKNVTFTVILFQFIFMKFSNDNNTII